MTQTLILASSCGSANVLLVILNLNTTLTLQDINIVVLVNLEYLCSLDKDDINELGDEGVQVDREQVLKHLKGTLMVEKHFHFFY